MSQPPVPIKLLLDPGHFLALGCGAGLLRPAPGTWGTLLALVLGWAIFKPLPTFWFALGIALLFGLGVWLCGRTAKALATDDHSAIVWDEFVGFWLACLALPQGWMWILLALLLFRCFDIFKPWPIGWLDRHMKGGWGIMLDDLVAGFLALLVIQAVQWALVATGTMQAV